MARKVLYLVIVIALAASAFIPISNAQASTTKNNFSISIYDAINAAQIGYPRNYQFVFSIITSENKLARQFLLRQGQRINVEMERGWYAFTLSDQKGKVLAKHGYRYIPAGANVRWQSNLGPPDLTPRIKIKID